MGQGLAERVFLGVRQWNEDSCLPACIATVLRVMPETVPAVDFSAGAGRWWEPYQRALRAALGYELVSLDPAEVFAGYWIALVDSLTRDAPAGHAVVMRGTHLIWDPGHGEPLYERVGPEDAKFALHLLPLDPGGLDSCPDD